MCGIAGILLRPHADLPDLRDRLQQMAGSMQHRGPDDEGLYISPDGRVGFVNRRLAIRDLSPAGHMPMSNADQTVWITYNGEVYNTDELRPELEQLGYTFRSTSDTEVILKGYEAWGSAVVDRLRGMFAFAIHDQRTPQFLLARDHLGIKPIYTAETPTAFVFASELKTLFASGLISRDVSAAGLVGYLLTGSVPNPLTLYAQVHALPPSTYLQAALPLTAPLQPVTYWSLPTTLGAVTALDEAVEQTRALLAEAVRIRLVSDVPLGAFLSGGLDSSAVVACMRQATTGTIRTCSMIFAEAEYSEAPYARAMAEHVGAEHFERVITADDLAKEFDNILYALDQPSVDGVNTYFVSQTARQAGLTVALSGLGGDELFGGYGSTFAGVPQTLGWLQTAHRVPAGGWLAQHALDLLPQRRRWGRLRDAFGRPAAPASAYAARRGLFSAWEVRQLVRPEVWTQAVAEFDLVRHIDAQAGVNSADLFAWTSRAELRTYTHHQLLRDTDVMSMIHSLEVRVPLLDKRLVDYVLRLPARLKTSADGRPKPLLNQALRSLLPPLILERRDKQGFTFPFDVWLRRGLTDRLQQLTAETRLNALLTPSAVQDTHQQFTRGQVHWSRPWALAALSAVV